MANHPMDLNPNTLLIIPLFRIRGGKEHLHALITDQQQGNSRVTTRRVTTKIANEPEYATAIRLRGQALHVVRKFSTRTLVGYLLDKAHLPEMTSELDMVRQNVQAFNAIATSCQVNNSWLSIEIALALGPEAARALADHVRGELVALHTALREGDPTKARNILLGCHNLHRLAVGVQAHAIQFAIEEADQARKALKRAIKGDGSVSETPESAGRALDLGMLENGISTFTYADLDQISDLSSVGA